MLFSKQDYEALLTSLNKKFALYDFIDNNYLMNMLDSLMNNGSFEELKILPEELSKDVNPLFYINFRIQNFLYCKICKLCEDDIEVLLNLVEDKRRVINLILRKMKVEDTSKIDDYIMNIASLYNGVEAFDSFVTRYVMSAIKGVPFEVEKKQPVSITSTDENKEDKKKKKKKKKKEQKKIEIQVIEQEIAEPKIVEPEIIEQKSSYQECLKLCLNKENVGVADSFVQLSYYLFNFEYILQKEDCPYKMYLFLRFGHIKHNYFNREEIGDILNLSINEIISYERNALEELRNFLNYKFDGYSSYLLRKTIR